MPCQRGAFYTYGKFRYSGKHRQLAQLFRSAAFAGDQCVELCEHLSGFGGGLAFEALRHHGRRRLGDGAALAFKTNIADGAVVHIQIDRKVVAAQRIKAFGFAVRSLGHAKIPRTLAVLQNHFLIQIAQVRHYASTSETF